MDRASLPGQQGQILARRVVVGPWQVLWRYTEVSRVAYVVVGAATSLVLSALTTGLSPRYPPERSTPLQRSYERNVSLIADAKQRSEALARPFVTPAVKVER